MPIHCLISFQKKTKAKRKKLKLQLYKISKKFTKKVYKKSLQKREHLMRCSLLIFKLFLIMIELFSLLRLRRHPRLLRYHLHHGQNPNP